MNAAETTAATVAVLQERVRILHEVEVIVLRAMQQWPREEAMKLALLGVEINQAVAGIGPAAKDETRAS